MDIVHVRGLTEQSGSSQKREHGNRKARNFAEYPNRVRQGRRREYPDQGVLKPALVLARHRVPRN
jgi:hypothetical protein